MLIVYKGTILNVSCFNELKYNVKHNNEVKVKI